MFERNQYFWQTIKFQIILSVGVLPDFFQIILSVGVLPDF